MIYAASSSAYGTNPVPWRPAFPGVEYPPPGSETVVVRPPPGWPAAGLVAGAVLVFGAALVQAFA